MWYWRLECVASEDPVVEGHASDANAVGVEDPVRPVVDLAAERHGWALVGFGFPDAKLLWPVDEVSPIQAYCANGDRPALARSLTSSSHLMTRSHRPTSPTDRAAAAY
jgi:hypothetical protein